MAYAAMTKAKAITPLLAEWAGNHHRLVVNPLAYLGVRIPSGKNNMVARAPVTTWATRILRSELSLLSELDPVVSVDCVLPVEPPPEPATAY